MTKSLKQIIKEVRELCEAHGQVESFHYGDTLRLLSEGAINYTTVLMNISRTSVNRDSNDITVELLVLDRVKKGDNDNQLDSENTTYNIIRDLSNTIGYSTRWRRFSDLLTSSPTQKYYDHLPDAVTGHSVSITLKMYNDEGICDLPIFDYDFNQPITEEDCDVLAIVVNSDNTQLATKIVTDSDNIILVPNITFTDSDGSSSSVASGVSITATQCPTFEDATIHNSDDSYTTTVGSGDDLELPNSDISINGVLFESLPATNDLDIDVIQSTGNTTVGSKQGQFYRIADSNVTNSDNSFNVSIQSEDNLILSDNTITDGYGNTHIVPAQNDFTVPTCTVTPDSLYNPIKTGATSVISGDDGTTQAGRGVDRLTLDFINPFGNTTRFTNDLGGDHKDNSDGSTVGYFIDNATKLGYTMDSFIGTMPQGIAQAQIHTVGSYSGFRVPNVMEWVNIMLPTGFYADPYLVNTTSALWLINKYRNTNEVIRAYSNINMGAVPLTYSTNILFVRNHTY